MSRPADKLCEMRVTLPATFDAIEGLCAEFRRQSRGRATRSQSFGAELLLREALTNAAVHGCGLDPAKSVRCSIRMDLRRLAIAVRDEGGGFDWRQAQSHRASATDTSGRGMEILERYSTRLRFGTQGNSVFILKRFQTEETNHG